MRSDVAMPDYIHVRVFREEKRTLEKLAQEKGTSLSELIRASVLPQAGEASPR
ncbi:DUF6290 family protein [Phyllobacterium leguminum]|uniref:Ribbon-helix-helix CopG family protein n=1 Tax=Phyllobacterium leguminum TaxID=314237 RepID=A0A318T426_9HYPH|nr:ribbon-helix-helix protein, CopG family [Phyllobacterium leguminum]PYE88770.1 ribbon-helix-helix CopG family protein [Phyllobacterium leguminum]